MCQVLIKQKRDSWPWLRVSFYMGMVGLEPTLDCSNRILNPARLPIPPHPQNHFVCLSFVDNHLNQIYLYILLLFRFQEK